MNLTGLSKQMGKTTLLRLIQATVQGEVGYLDTIPFKSFQQYFAESFRRRIRMRVDRNRFVHDPDNVLLKEVFQAEEVFDLDSLQNDLHEVFGEYSGKERAWHMSAFVEKLNGIERIKKKKTSKKKLENLNNIYELPKEESKQIKIKNKQKKNKLSQYMKNINNTNDNLYNQKNKLNNNNLKKVILSNRKNRYNIKDKENKKRSITPLNSKLKRYFNQ